MKPFDPNLRLWESQPDGGIPTQEGYCLEFE